MLLSAAINIQQLARKREERLGVLEYELRVAKEDLAETQVHGQVACHTLSHTKQQLDACMTVMSYIQMPAGILQEQHNKRCVSCLSRPS